MGFCNRIGNQDFAVVKMGAQHRSDHKASLRENSEKTGSLKTLLDFFIIFFPSELGNKVDRLLAYRLIIKQPKQMVRMIKEKRRFMHSSLTTVCNSFADFYEKLCNK